MTRLYDKINKVSSTSQEIPKYRLFVEAKKKRKKEEVEPKANNRRG